MLKFTKKNRGKESRVIWNIKS